VCCYLLALLLFAATIAAATISKVGAYDNLLSRDDIAACILSGTFSGLRCCGRDSFKHRYRYLPLQLLVVVIFSSTRSAIVPAPSNGNNLRGSAV
jgi:hypothetical protein